MSEHNNNLSQFLIFCDHVDLGNMSKHIEDGWR